MSIVKRAGAIICGLVAVGYLVNVAGSMLDPGPFDTVLVIIPWALAVAFGLGAAWLWNSAKPTKG